MTTTTDILPAVRQKPHSVNTEPHFKDSVVVKYHFPNGFGASVIRSPYSYGGPSGLWELGVITEASGWCLNYATPITSDVLGWLTDDDVQRTLDAIEALEPVR